MCHPKSVRARVNHWLMIWKTLTENPHCLDVCLPRNAAAHVSRKSVAEGPHTTRQRSSSLRPRGVPHELKGPQGSRDAVNMRKWVWLASHEAGFHPSRLLEPPRKSLNIGSPLHRFLLSLLFAPKRWLEAHVLPTAAMNGLGAY